MDFDEEGNLIEQMSIPLRLDDVKIYIKHLTR